MQDQNLETRRVVTVRLNHDEIRFLRQLGQGDLSAGVRVAIERAGYETTKEHFKGYRVIREIVNLNGEQGAKYTLLLNGELVGPALTVSDSIFKALMERHGELFVMEDVIAKSFVKLPKEVQIDKIYDPAGKVVWSKYN